MDKRYSLILTVVNKNFGDTVMNAARAAGARGGTVLNARGTGKKETDTIMGITIEPEKEVIMILTDDAVRHDIMMAIYREAGLETRGAGFSMSLPVADILGGIGLKNFTNTSENPDDATDNRE